MAGAAVQRTYAELVRITPRRAASDYVAVSPDPTFPEVELRAVFSEETSAENLRGQRLSGESQGTTQVVSSQSAIQIMASEVALRLRYPIKRGYLVTLLTRHCEPTYTVNLADPLDTGDLVLYLSPERVAK